MSMLLHYDVCMRTARLACFDTTFNQKIKFSLFKLLKVCAISVQQNVFYIVLVFTAHAIHYAYIDETMVC